MTQAQAATDSQLRSVQELPLAGCEFELRDFRRAGPAPVNSAAIRAGDSQPLATARLVFAAGAGVTRYDWYRDRPYTEELVVEESAMRLDRLKRGAPLLNTHSSYDLSRVLGVAENPTVRKGVAECDVTFSRREDVAGYVQDVADGVIRNVSVGYARRKVEMVPPKAEGGQWVYRVIDWEPFEVSLVPIPADMNAQVRSDGQAQAAADGAHAVRTFSCEFIETRSMPTVGEAAATETRKEHTMSGENQAAGGTQGAVTNQADEVAQRAAIQAAVAAEAQRSSDISTLCARHGMADQAADHIKAQRSVDQVRALILDTLATRDASAGNAARNVHISTEIDEVATRHAGMEEALMARVNARATLTEHGSQYRGMSLLEMGRDYLEFRGVNTRGMSRMQLATQMLTYRSAGLGTSDFANLLANVATKRLRQAYDENVATYGRWARRAPDAPDFKSMSVVQLGAAPDLLQTNEYGEFKHGAMTDGRETYSLLTYGRIVTLSRQAIVNDDLRGFDRLVGAFGDSAKRLENRTVYAILTANAALSDGGNLFNATAVSTAGGHANLTGTGTAISVASLGVGRTAMRLQKGLQSEELNIAPRFLIVPSAQEQLAYQFTSANYVPATAATINEFRAGGRTAVEPIVESILDANSATAWYLAADSGSVDTVEYCYLQGESGPVMEQEMGFEVDGVSWKCRLDFAAKAIDFRGLYKNNGA